MNHAITWGQTSPFTQNKSHAASHALLCGWLVLCEAVMFTANLLDGSQVCSCSLKIIHCPPFYPGGATGSWWSGSAKTPNWRRRSAAARSQRGQMPLLMYHVFKAGQQCVCAWAGVGGERMECLPRHSHIDANLTHAWALPMVCVTISSSLIDLWRDPLLPFSSCAVLCQDWELARACGHPAHQGRDPFRWSLLNGAMACCHRTRMPDFANYSV